MSKFLGSILIIGGIVVFFIVLDNFYGLHDLYVETQNQHNEYESRWSSEWLTENEEWDWGYLFGGILFSMFIIGLGVVTILLEKRNSETFKKFTQELKELYTSISSSFIKIRESFSGEIMSNFLIANCKKCYDKEFEVVQFNNNYTGVSARCTNCGKQNWVEINDHDKNINIQSKHSDYLSIIKKYYTSDVIKKINDYNEKIETFATKETIIVIPDIDQTILVRSNSDSFNKIVKHRQSIPKSIKQEVWQRDGGKCVECGSKEKLEYDHIIPVSKGGANTVRNIQLLCENCNRTKSNKIA